MKRDTPAQFSPMTLTLHWLVALGMIALLAVGVYMVETSSYQLYSWHKSFGILIFLVIVIRVIWRIKNGWPTPVGTYNHLEHTLAKVIHWILIIATLVMPISGVLNSALGGHGVALFGMELVAKNIDPDNPRKALVYSENLYALAHGVHHWVGNLLIASIVLHVVGAFKHHIIDADGTLRRIFGAKI